MKVWLKYRQKGAALGTTTAMQFDAVIAEPNEDVEGLTQIGLNGTDFVHTSGSRPTWYVLIGADELVDAVKRAFIDEFWIGAQQWIIVDDAATEPGAGLFREVSRPFGPNPLASTNGSRALPRIELNLRAKKRD